ncbi:MAG: formylmethanofuran dehydrogenase subunit E family protein [Desulfobacterales bacterium]|nr:formylmethanofuran dehydrogenase subunit E family protein [Desulfobacterales bacterium]
MVQRFHGYAAPGVMIGARMVDVAMSRMPPGVLFDAVCESSKCLPDAVQLLTPCTCGNGWLRVVPLGRFAVTLYDKRNGQGVRVHVDPARLDSFPETRYWFFGTRPKRKDRSELLNAEIRLARETIFGVRRVQVKPALLSKAPSDPRAICPGCGEAYPAGHGPPCRGCRVETAYYS